MILTRATEEPMRLAVSPPAGGEGFEAFRGIFTGMVAGGALWLGLVWFVFALLRTARHF